MIEPNQLSSENRVNTISPGLYHDLCTPLNQIIGYCEILIDQVQDDGQIIYMPDLRNIQTAGKELLGMLGNNVSIIESPDPLQDSHTMNSEPLTSINIKPELLEPSSDKVSETTAALILVVDDNPANRDLLSRRLERQGYSVVMAQDGLQAMAIVRQREFDLVLLDIMMPEMDGFAVLQAMKIDPALCHIPVIMISAFGEMEGVVRCIEMGADDFLPKPFDPILLKARIGSCLDKKRDRDREVHLHTELEVSHLRLKELEKQRTDLTNMIIHDLRTPLTSLITGMQSLEGEVGESPFQREMIDISISGGQTLLGMINDLLDVEKMESGTMHLDYTTIDAIKIVDNAAAQVSSLCGEKNLNVVKLASRDLPTFQGDEPKLGRVLVNLLGNAVKFTPTGGTLTVHADVIDDGQLMEFSVTDTGEGIPAEAFIRIFEKFGQVESRQGGRKMSTGLGLAFCKLAVEAHGGTIGVRSMPGEGSVFSFTVPIAITPAE